MKNYTNILNEGFNSYFKNVSLIKSKLKEFGLINGKNVDFTKKIIDLKN